MALRYCLPYYLLHPSTVLDVAMMGFGFASTHPTLATLVKRYVKNVARHND